MKAVQIANAFLNMNNNKDTCTINKLPYFAHMLSLYLYKEPLFDDDILVWKNGPVIKNVHKVYNKKNKKLDKQESLSDDDIKEKYLVNCTSNYFINYTGEKLVNLTHVKGSAWYTTIKDISNLKSDEEIKKFIENELRKFNNSNHNNIFKKKIRIDNELILKEFSLPQYDDIRNIFNKKVEVNNLSFLDKTDIENISNTLKINYGL